ncbi:MAG: helix-turn-helix domain-containing protein [Desulfotomaculales bacterium]
MFFGRRLRELRRHRGFSLSEFARRTGFSASYLSAVERGLARPNAFFVSRAADVLCVSPAYLESGSEDVLDGDGVRQLRESRGLSIAELAEISGIPAETIRRVESGEFLPGEEEVERLSEALNYPLEPPAKSSGELVYASLGRRIRRFRCRQGLSVSEIARRVGVSPGLISQIESGRTIPLLKTLESIARCLNVPLANLLTEEKDIQKTLVSLDKNTREAIADPKVQVLLKALSDCDAREFWFILEFINFFHRQAPGENTGSHSTFEKSW